MLPIGYYVTMFRGQSKQLAKIVGTNESNMSRLLNAKRRPSAEYADKLVDLFPFTTLKLWHDGTAREIKAAFSTPEAFERIRELKTRNNKEEGRDFEGSPPRQDTTRAEGAEVKPPATRR